MMKKKTLQKLLWRVSLVGVTVLAMLLLLSCCFVDNIIFQPPAPRPPVAALIHLEVAPGQTIALRHIPSASPDADTILYSHGNAEDLNMLEPLFQEYVKRGYGIAAYDYEGYGQSSGTPSEGRACRDIERVYAYLTEEAGVPAERIVILGFSVGTGPSTYLAEKRDAAALVLCAPFTSTFAVVFAGWAPRNRFPNIDRIANINMPLLIVHGDRDGIIPYRHGQKLFETAVQPKEFLTVPRAGHNNIIAVSGENYWDTLRNFLERHRRR